MTQNGVVTALQGKNARVRFVRSEACAQCRLCDFGAKEEVETVLPNDLGAQVGDTVCVELHARKVLRASAVAYLVPLCALLVGLFLGRWVAPHLGFDNADLFACAAALGMTALAFLGIYLTEKRRGEKALYAPRMLRILQDPADTGETD